MARIGSYSKHASRHQSTGDDAVSITNADVAAGAAIALSKLDGAAASSSTGTIASDTLRNSNDSLKQTDSSSYVKLKEVKLNADLPACRIKFDLHGGSFEAPFDAYGRIYKNGVAIGTEQHNDADVFTTYSEDFTGFVANDLIQIYGRQAGAIDCAIRNMRFYYNSTVTSIDGKTLSTALPDTSDPTISMTNQDP